MSVTGNKTSASQGNGSHVTFKCGKGKKQMEVYAKLMSISSGLKKNILPK